MRDKWHRCPHMERAVESPEFPIIETRKFREIGITLLDGGDSNVLLAFCPWCGSRLPDSSRNQWFDELERKNVDPYGADIPNEFLTSEWYESR